MKWIVFIGVAWFVSPDLGQSVIFDASAEAAPMHADVSISSPTKLECSFDLASAHSLKVKVKISNQGRVDLFILNRLWNLNSRSKDVDDPEQVYRFVRNSELRLLWGIAPLPELKTTTYQNIPYASVLRPKSSLEWEYSAKVPVAEYNVYFSGSARVTHQSAVVKRVVVIVDFVEAQAGLTTTPSLLGSSVKVSTPHAADFHKSVVCASGPIQLEALRRTDEFSRLDMADEKPEPLILPLR